MIIRSLLLTTTTVLIGISFGFQQQSIFLSRKPQVIESLVYNPHEEREHYQILKFKHSTSTRETFSKNFRDDSSMNEKIDAFLGISVESHDNRQLMTGDEQTSANSSPNKVVRVALEILRTAGDRQQLLENGNDQAALEAAQNFLDLCAPLTRSVLWGMGPHSRPWLEILRGSLHPNMFLNRLRESQEYSILLNWDMLSVTEGYQQYSASIVEEKEEDNDDVDDEEEPQHYFQRNAGISIAFVNVALFQHNQVPGMESAAPTLIQFQLKKSASGDKAKAQGRWFIDNAVISKKDLFINS